MTEQIVTQVVCVWHGCNQATPGIVSSTPQRTAARKDAKRMGWRIDGPQYSWCPHHQELLALGYSDLDELGG